MDPYEFFEKVWEKCVPDEEVKAPVKVKKDLIFKNKNRIVAYFENGDISIKGECDELDWKLLDMHHENPDLQIIAETEHTDETGKVTWSASSYGVMSGKLTDIVLQDVAIIDGRYFNAMETACAYFYRANIEEVCDAFDFKPWQSGDCTDSDYVRNHMREKAMNYYIESAVKPFFQKALVAKVKL